MVAKTAEERTAAAAGRALARSALYQLLSQSLAYPSGDAVQTLREADLPQAQEAADRLPAKLASRLARLADEVRCRDAAQLQAEHRHIFSHVMSQDAPPCETLYTASHLFQETNELSDIAGFYRAFGLEPAEQERLDHISVELEFMQFLAYKEAYALLHHGEAKARLCRRAQRAFMRDHLGRWGLLFAQRLREKAGEGYFASVAALAEEFLLTERRLLRTQPEPAAVGPGQWETGPEDSGCPAAEACPLVT